LFHVLALRVRYCWYLSGRAAASANAGSEFSVLSKCNQLYLAGEKILEQQGKFPHAMGEKAG
jgi:hypothetical protein